MFLFLVLLLGCTTKLNKEYIELRNKFDYAVHNSLLEESAYKKFNSVEEINSYYNKIKYKTEKEDHWKTVSEFLKDNSGDCEDFAVAKYISLYTNNIGKSNSVAIVYDVKKQNYHAITLSDGNVLDNQLNQVVSKKITEKRYIYIYELYVN